MIGKVKIGKYIFSAVRIINFFQSPTTLIGIDLGQSFG
jgi:hypothetical protein